MLLDYHLGQTSVVFRIKLRNSSVSTGAGLTGLTNASSGLVIATIADNEATTTAYTGGSTVQTITTLGTYAAPSASNCRFKEVDATNHPGVYEVQLADARFAVASAKSLLVSISGATNLAQCDVVIPLRTVNPYDANFGLTNLDAAVSTRMATFTLPTNFSSFAIDASGRIDLGKILGTASAGAAGYVGLDWGHITAATTVVNLSGTTIGTLTTNSDKTGYSLATAPPTAAAIATTVWQDLTSGSDFSTASSVGKLLKDNVDATVSSRLATSGYTAPPSAATIATTVWQDTTASSDFSTAGSIGLLLKTDIDAAVSSRSTYAGGDTSGTTTLLSRLSSTRATNLDNLDAAVSSRLAPTVAGRTLDVSATGEAGLDWANIGAPTTTVNLSGTTISTGQAVASVSGAVGSVTGNVGGNVVGSVASVTAAVTLSTSQALAAARALDAIADTSLTLNDALHCAIAAAVGKESVSGTSYLIKTPSTGTTLRTFTLDSTSAPTSRT